MTATVHGKNGAQMAEWFENDLYWETTYAHNFSESRFQRAETEVDQVLKLAGYQCGEILDLACGPGTHSLPLARRGCQVTGVDRTKYLIEIAQKAAANIEPAPRFIVQDMRNFVMPDKFDLALLMFNSLGFFEDPKSDLTVLQNLHQSLRRDAVLVIETLGKELAGRRFQPTTSNIASDGSLLVLRHAIVDDWTRASEDWILLQKGRVHRFRFEYTLYSGQELRELLGQAGFGQVTLFGDFDGREYGLGASRLVAVARKTD
jgi:SAM-dependent methyltransferase